MQRIIVSIESLQEKLAKIVNDGMNMVELFIVPSQTEDVNMYPTFLHFEGIDADGCIDELSSSDCALLHKSA